MRPSTNRCVFAHSTGTVPSLSRLLALSAPRVFLLLILLAVVSSALAQTELPIRGVVVSKDSQPLAGVTVAGSIWKQCCPYQRDIVSTNEKGEFLLPHSGAVIHFLKERMRPLTLVVQPGTTPLHIVLTPTENDLPVPPCSQPQPRHKLIGSGKYGLHFSVPKNEVKILDGKADTDYVRYVIKPKNGDSFLALWFGPYAIPSEPEDEQFINSSSFSQRNLVAVNGGGLGADTWGQSKNGLSWRHTGTMGSGAVYQDATKEEAQLFDQIINSICTVPYPKK